MSADVIQFPQPEGEGRLRGIARCLACSHEWEAICPIGTVWLECPQRRLVKGRLKYPVEESPGAQIWQCLICGCDALYATPTALRCCGCGTRQRPYDSSEGAA